MSQLQTFQVSSGRSSRKELIDDFQLISSNQVAVSILDRIPTLVLILNQKREIVFSNKAFQALLETDSIESILGMKPGDVLGCSMALAGPDGCGTAKGCRTCGALKSVKIALEGDTGSEECTIKAGPTSMMHLKVTSEMIQLGDKDFILYSMQDISQEKKKALLERIFYHDILNSAHNINSMAELISDNEAIGNREEYLGLLTKSTNELIDEINTQRILSNGNNANYISNPVSINSFHFYKDLKSEFESLADGGLIISLDKRSENFNFSADKVLLKSVVTNMMKNAIEAEQYRGKITIGMMSLNEKGAMLWVHNQLYMSEEVQSQIFNRSFSTKGSDRGLGTYSMKILTERFMKGKISFTSSVNNGTTFIIEIPSRD
jgi:nitrogen-specific signal transduction histidine kinase